MPSVGIFGRLAPGSTAESFWLWISGLGMKVSLMNLETGARQGNHQSLLEEILGLQIMQLSINSSIKAAAVSQLCLLFQRVGEKPQENE